MLKGGGGEGVPKRHGAGGSLLAPTNKRAKSGNVTLETDTFMLHINFPHARHNRRRQRQL